MDKNVGAVKKWAAIFAAMNCVGAGVAIFLATKLGSDAIAVFCDGMHSAFRIRFGHASLLFNFVVIAVSMLLSRKNIGCGTVVYALCSGYLIEFYGMLFNHFSIASQHLFLRLLWYFAGMALLSCGLALLIYHSVGMSAVDAFLFGIQRYLKFPYYKLRTAFDILLLISGFFMGGVIGIGTFLCALGTGTLVKYQLRWMKGLKG